MKNKKVNIRLLFNKEKLNEKDLEDSLNYYNTDNYSYDEY